MRSFKLQYVFEKHPWKGKRSCGQWAEPSNSCSSSLYPMDLTNPEIIFVECWIWILAYPSRPLCSFPNESTVSVFIPVNHSQVAEKSSSSKPELCRPICYGAQKICVFVRLYTLPKLVKMVIREAASFVWIAWPQSSKRIYSKWNEVFRRNSR